MRIANTISDSIVDGPGLRFTVFTINDETITCTTHHIISI